MPSQLVQPFRCWDVEPETFSRLQRLKGFDPREGKIEYHFGTGIRRDGGADSKSLIFFQCIPKLNKKFVNSAFFVKACEYVPWRFSIRVG
jgi:hypothetical protein